MPDKKTAAWGGHPLLNAKDSEGLELAAAVNEYHHGLNREQAERKALDEYRRTSHAKAAAHHLMGLRAAQASGSHEDAHKHSDLYSLHLKALGHEPHEGVPAEVKRHTMGENVDRAYNFKGHGADQFLVQQVKKHEIPHDAYGYFESLMKAANLPSEWPCANCGNDIGDGSAQDTSGKAICDGCVPLPLVRDAAGNYMARVPHGVYGINRQGSGYVASYAPREDSKFSRYGTWANLGRGTLQEATAAAQNHHHSRGPEKMMKADRFQLLDLDDAPGPTPDEVLAREHGNQPPAAPKRPLAMNTPEGGAASGPSVSGSPTCPGCGRQGWGGGGRPLCIECNVAEAEREAEFEALERPQSPAPVTERLHVTDPRRYYQCSDCDDSHDIYGGVKDRFGREVGKYRPSYLEDDEMVRALTERYRDDPAVLAYYGLQQPSQVAKSELLTACRTLLESLTKGDIVKFPLGRTQPADFNNPKSPASVETLDSARYHKQARDKGLARDAQEQNYLKTRHQNSQNVRNEMIQKMNLGQASDDEVNSLDAGDVWDYLQRIGLPRPTQAEFNPYYLHRTVRRMREGQPGAHDELVTHYKSRGGGEMKNFSLASIPAQLRMRPA